MGMFILFFLSLCDVKFIWPILSYLNFFHLKPSDRLSSFPLETLENMFRLSGSIWIHKRKVNSDDRQPLERGQISLAFESAGLSEINFIGDLWRDYFSYTTRLLLIWRQCSSFTKNKSISSYFEEFFCFYFSREENQEPAFLTLWAIRCERPLLGLSVKIWTSRCSVLDTGHIERTSGDLNLYALNFINKF